jgi:hypothetical protein
MSAGISFGPVWVSSHRHRRHRGPYWRNRWSRASYWLSMLFALELVFWIYFGMGWCLWQGCKGARAAWRSPLVQGWLEAHGLRIPGMRYPGRRQT